MRVAHFVQRFPPALGGSEAYFARLSRFLAERGHEVTVHTTTGLDLESFWSPSARQVAPGVVQENGVTVHRHSLRHLPWQRYLLKGLSLVNPVPAWQPWLQWFGPRCPTMWDIANRNRPENNVDVVHATAFPYAWPILCARRLARRLKVGFLLTPFLHLGDPEDPHDRTRRAYTQPALRGLLRSADFIFAQTTGEKQALKDLGIDSSNIIFQGMGVDSAEVTGGDRNKVRAVWGVGLDEVVVGHLGNNSWEKGTVDLLMAAEKSWSKGASFVVVLAGSEMPNFLSFWEQHKPSGRVIRLGPIDEDGKRDFFAGIDVFGLPSRADSFGLVFLEAWANGIPNLAYRTGGVPWVIRDESDGLLVRCGAIEELADRLTRLISDAPLRRRLGENGRQRVLNEYRWGRKLALVDEVCDLANDLARCAADKGIPIS
jgi:glycosyltransferase involved in cell wall biosynthesis